MRLFLAALLATLFAAGPVLPADDSALSKEGFWTVGRGDAEAKSCMASINVGETAMLLIQVAPGHIDFVVGTKKPMRKGKRGVLAVGDQRFDFEPAYSDKRDWMFLEDVGGRALDAVRKARWISAVVDGRELVLVNVENTGVAGALDAVVACSEGKSGWWGPGVGAAATVATVEDPTDAGDGLVYSEPGAAWGMGTSDAGCIIQAAAPDQRFLQLLAVTGDVGLAIGSTSGPLPRGRKVRVETDSYRFEFKPEYDGASYMNSAHLLERADVFALRRAKSMRITVDGSEILDVDFEGDTFLDAMDAVTACSRGEKGWWGEGAKPPAS